MSLAEIPGWTIVEGKLYRRYKFPDFVSALAFVNQIGAVAEELGHHPNIAFTWGLVEITIFTHSINGLSEADYALAAKINALRS